MSSEAVTSGAIPEQAASRNLPDRPLLCTPQGDKAAHGTAKDGAKRQPKLGFAGLLVVVPVAAVVAAGAGGFETSLRILGPLSTFALPVAAMIAFWWEDWPGSRLRPPLAMLVDVLLVIAGGIAITVLGQAVVGRPDLGALFDPNLGTFGHTSTFPATMPLAGAFFVVMLQLTLVNEGWPLRGLRREVAGPVALLVCWAIALSVYLTLVDTGNPSGTTLFIRAGHPFPGPQFSALLLAVSVWQVLFYVLLRSWPFGLIANRAPRLLIANLTVVAGGGATYLLAIALGVEPLLLADIGGALIAAMLLQAMLFDGFPRLPDDPARERLIALLVVAMLAVGLYFCVAAVARLATWTTTSANAWIAFACLNAIGIAILVHVAISRRWPFLQEPEVA
jgi:hypothetical protein